MSKLKVGDIVRATKYEPSGQIGKIVEINYAVGDLCYLVCFKDWSGGHDAKESDGATPSPAGIDYSGKHCWWCWEDDLELVENQGIFSDIIYDLEEVLAPSQTALKETDWLPF